MGQADSQAALVARLRAARETGGEEEIALAAELRRRFLDVVEGYRIGVANDIARKDWDAARATLAAAEARFPQAAWVALDAAALARGLGDREGATAHAGQARAREPDNPKAFRAGCAAERERGRFEAAEALLAESLRRFGPLAWVWAERARVAEAAGRHKDARRLAEILRAQYPQDPAGYQIGLAACRALGDFAAAMSLAEQGEAQAPGKAWPLAARASLSHALGRIDDAAALAETLRARFPDEEAGYGAGFVALRARERLPEALAVAEAAARRFPHRTYFAEQAAELRALSENRARAHGLTRRLAAAPPAFARPRVVVTLGMHRTGSSLAARMLGELGVGLGGPLMSANFANSDGYFEHLGVVAAHDAALRQMGVSWDACWSALARTPRLDEAGQAQSRARLEDIVERELDANAGLWGFKDPRALRFLPLWGEMFERLGVEPVWLLCVRDPRAVAASLHARDRTPLAIGELLWIEHVLEALRQLGPRLSMVLHYERWFLAPEAQLQALARAVGRSAEGVAPAARADLRHQTPDAAPALPLSTAIYEALAAPDADLVDLQARAAAMTRRLGRLANGEDR